MLRPEPQNNLAFFPAWDVMQVASTTLKSLTLSSNSWACNCLSVQKLESAVQKFKGRVEVPDFKLMKCRKSKGKQAFGTKNS